MVLAGGTSLKLLRCWCYFILTGRFYVSWLLFHASDIPSWLLRAVNASTSSELYTLTTFGCFIFARLFRHIFTASATVLNRCFLPTGVFYVTLLPHIVAHFVTQMRAGTPHSGSFSVPALSFRLTHGLELLIL